MDATRLTQESPRPRKDFRPEFRLDRDRVLYAPQFARLAEITQVVSPENGYVFHNRLTHSIKVAQIARSIAESMRAAHPAFTGHIDPDAAEAAGLAHDLGHPPFGHIAEQALDALVRGYGVPDGFEGNAQSFRIACRLGMDYFPFDRDHRYRGLESDEYALYLFSTRLITEFVVAMTPKKRVAGLGVSVPPGFRHKVDILKQLVWTYAIRDADLAMTQLGQVRAIRTVFRLMMRACARKNYDLFPEGYRSWFASAATKQVAVRAVADYIAGLTERDLLGVYRRTLATAR